MPTWFHGYLSNSVDFRGSILWTSSLQHTGHFWIRCSIWLDKFSHHTDSLARSLHLVIPWWPSCSRCKISCCSSAGMTLLLPLINNPSLTESSRDTVIYGLSILGHFVLVGHPFLQNSANFLQITSSSCFCQIGTNLCSVAGWECTYYLPYKYFHLLLKLLISFCWYWIRCPRESICYNEVLSWNVRDGETKPHQSEPKSLYPQWQTLQTLCAQDRNQELMVCNHVKMKTYKIVGKAFRHPGKSQSLLFDLSVQLFYEGQCSWDISDRSVFSSWLFLS